jgi:hypothetical protein
MKHFGVRRALLGAMVVSMWVVPAFAQTTTHPSGSYPARETQIKRLGTRQRFSMPMHTTDELRTMVNRNRGPLNQALSVAGLSGLSGQVMDTLSTGAVTETTIQPGTHMEWMAMKRGGVPTITQNIRWSGAQPFEAWQFTITDGGYTYTFLMPKICGNLTLLSAVSIPPATVSEARPEPPAPPPPAPPAPPAIVAVVPVPPAPVPPAPVAYRSYNPWMASAFIGSSFSTSSNTLEQVNSVPAGLTYGGQVGYLYHGIVGGEFLADFAPDVGFNSILFDAGQPHVNSYMINAIGAAPFGGDGQYQPYISGGFGWIGLRGDVTSLPDDQGNTFTTSANNSRWGGNLGGGMNAYVGHWGVRGDVRWFQASGGTGFSGNDTVGENIGREFLSNLHFWRGTLGLAFRF